MMEAFLAFSRLSLGFRYLSGVAIFYSEMYGKRENKMKKTPEATEIWLYIRLPGNTINEYVSTKDVMRTK